MARNERKEDNTRWRHRDEKPRRHSDRDRERERKPAGDPQHAPRKEPTGNHRYVWGVNPVLEVLRVRPDDVERVLMSELAPKLANEVLSRAKDARIRVEKVDRSWLGSLAEGGSHQGLVAEVKQFEYAEVGEILTAAEKSKRPPLVVVLDGIQDPQNLGAIIRSAHSFGAHGVVIAKDRAVGVTPVVAKASAGALEHCLIARVTNISRTLGELKEAGIWTVAADPDGDRALHTAPLEGPLAIVVGSEGPGVRHGVLEHCDFRVKIPMLGKVASLNASVSAGVLLYEVARQRLLLPSS